MNHKNWKYNHPKIFGVAVSMYAGATSLFAVYLAHHQLRVFFKKNCSGKHALTAPKDNTGNPFMQLRYLTC